MTSDDSGEKITNALSSTDRACGIPAKSVAGVRPPSVRVRPVGTRAAIRAARGHILGPDRGADATNRHFLAIVEVEPVGLRRVMAD